MYSRDVTINNACRLIIEAQEFFTEMLYNPERFRGWVASIKDKNTKAYVVALEKYFFNQNRRGILFRALKAVKNNEIVLLKQLLRQDRDIAKCLVLKSYQTSKSRVWVDDREKYTVDVADAWYRDRRLLVDLLVQRKRVDDALQDLEDKGQELGERKFTVDANAVNDYVRQAREAVAEFFTDVPANIQPTLFQFRRSGLMRKTTEFQRAFSRNSQRLHRQLSEHRNARYALANVLVAVTGIGALVMVVKKAVTGSFLFFNQTDSAKKASAANMAVHGIGRQISP